MLPNAYLLAKFRFDTAENERNFAKKNAIFSPGAWTRPRRREDRVGAGRCLSAPGGPSRLRYDWAAGAAPSARAGSGGTTEDSSTPAGIFYFGKLCKRAR